MRGLPILAPAAFARAFPAFVLRLIFRASTFASDASKASRIFRTSSLSVARCAGCSAAEGAKLSAPCLLG
jgi:hypothetical protein